MEDLKMCNCGFKNTENAKFCSNCGAKLEENILKEYDKIPQMLSVKDAHEYIFNKKISLGSIYNLVKTRAIPHCKVNDRILFDKEKTIQWWNKKLNDSTKPIKFKGIRDII
jgi:hypothetical protein